MDAVQALNNLHELVDVITDLLIQCLARFDDEKFSRAVSKLKFLATKLPSLTAAAEDTREGKRAIHLLDPKVKECSRLVRLVRDQRRGAGGAGARAPPPQSHFDEAVSREREEKKDDQIAQETAEEQQQQEEQEPSVEEKPEEKPSPWKDVSLLAVARFDFAGDVERNVLALKRGDGLVLLQEAKGFYYGRLADTSDEEAGLIAASYVEVFTAELLLQRYSQLNEKHTLLRAERDQAVQTAAFMREKVGAVIAAVNEIKNEETALRAERDALQDKLDEANERIEELLVQVEIVEAGLETAPEPIAKVEPVPAPVPTPVPTAEVPVPTPVAPIPIVALASPPPMQPAFVSVLSLSSSAISSPALSRPESPEIEMTSISKLLSALDEHLVDKGKQPPRHVKLFGGTRSLAAICEADNAAVPALLERLCERLLENGAAGIRTPGIFRLSASKSEVDAAKQEVQELGVWSFKPEKYGPIVIAELIKAFLRELNEPLLTHDLLPRWVLATKIKSSALQVPYVRALLASLPPEHIGTIEYLLNFLTIAIGYEESLLTLSNAALLFAPMFLSHDVSTDRKRADLLQGSTIRRTGFTPLFSRRRHTMSPEALEMDAVDLKELMTAGVNVVSMLLINFREIWLRFNIARPFTLVRAVKESGPAKSTDELEYKKGQTIGMFSKLPDQTYAFGECSGKVGRFLLAHTKVVEIGE
jgi:hypothetical protein